MDSLFVIRGRLQEVYAAHSKLFDKMIQFILALAAFYLINDNVGFMKAAAQPLATLALTVICTFFPLIMTVIAAALLILLHMYEVSLGILAVTALIFLIMFIFYFRLTPKQALVILLTPLAFMLKVPYIIPIAYALISTPICIVAIICGVIVFYMMEYVKKVAAALEGKGASGMMDQASSYAKQVFQNKEMWVVIVAFIICFLLVFSLRRYAVDHAWKFAIVAGAVVNVIVMAAGDIVLGIHTSYGSLIGGNVAAIVVGFILELFFFSVDYTRSETLRYEDDEYYYFVKAIPKLSVATPEKTVKRINSRHETEIIDTDKVRKRTGKKSPAKHRDMAEVDRQLLAQSLKKDLRLKD